MDSMIIAGVLIGLIATALSDLWAVFLEKAFKVPNYGFDVVGRWIGHMAHGQFLHKPIFASPPIPGERSSAGSRITRWAQRSASCRSCSAAARAGLPIRHGWPRSERACSRSRCPSSSWFPRSAWACSVRARRILARRRQGVIAHLYYGVALYIAAVLVAMLMR